VTGFATARAERIRRIAVNSARRTILVASIIHAFASGSTPVIAQMRQLQEPLRIRITWGGGAASEWTGRIVLERGALSELNVAELNADSAGSVWQEDRHIVVSSLSAREAESIELSAQAEE
jgi:hypothetical protein